nr:DNA excision repair enzyme [Heliothis virescens nudivirus]
MGILKFNNVFKQYIVDSYDTPDPSLEYTVHVDGNLTLFKGVINGCVDAHTIANNALDLLKAMMYRLSVKISEIVIYFDGLPPTRKHDTSKKRAVNLKFNAQAALQYYKAMLEEESWFRVVQLEVGESEMQMILDRDPTKPTILVTNDSDVYHIAYGRYDDEAPLYLLLNGGERFVNLQKFNVCGMPRNVFSAIVIMMGTDYTQPLLTPSMVSAICQCYVMRHQDATLLNAFDSITNDSLSKAKHWRTVLYEVCKVIFHAKNQHSIRIHFGSKVMDKRTANKDNPKLTWAENCTVERWVESLAWCSRYYEHGNRVDRYSNNEQCFEFIEPTSQWRLMKGAKSFGMGDLTSWREGCEMQVDEVQRGKQLQLQMSEVRGDSKRDYKGCSKGESKVDSRVDSKVDSIGCDRVDSNTSTGREHKESKEHKDSNKDESKHIPSKESNHSEIKESSEDKSECTSESNSESNSEDKATSKDESIEPSNCSNEASKSNSKEASSKSTLDSESESVTSTSTDYTIKSSTIESYSEEFSFDRSESESDQSISLLERVRARERALVKPKRIRNFVLFQFKDSLIRPDKAMVQPSLFGFKPIQQDDPSVEDSDPALEEPIDFEAIENEVSPSKIAKTSNDEFEPVSSSSGSSLQLDSDDSMSILL